jgi:hypothetical protein
MSDSPHPADADYAAQNEPDEAALMAMAESAIRLVGLVSDERVSRRAAASQTFSSERPSAPLPDLFVFTPPAYDTGVLDRALLAERQTPGRASAAESATIGQSIDVFRERLTLLRSLLIAGDAVMGHALNSIDLGLIGLAKVMGDHDALSA